MYQRLLELSLSIQFHSSSALHKDRQAAKQQRFRNPNIQTFYVPYSLPCLAQWATEGAFLSAANRKRLTVPLHLVLCIRPATRSPPCRMAASKSDCRNRLCHRLACASYVSQCYRALRYAPCFNYEELYQCWLLMFYAQRADHWLSA
jgi:hypothetical protein